MTRSPATMLQEARFLKFRTAGALGGRFMKKTMKDSVIFGGAARRALHMRKDTKNAKAAQKNPFIHGGLNAAGKRAIQGQLDAHGKEIDLMKRAGTRLAPTVGGIMLGATVAAKGYRYAKKLRNIAKQRTQYRGYDVYPEYGHAAVGIQPYNQPYYNDPNRAGAPRAMQARVGVYEREATIDKIVEAVSQG